MTNGFELHQGRLPLLVSMPHPGTHLTPEIARGLTARAQRLEDTDWHIPLLAVALISLVMAFCGALAGRDREIHP